MVRPRPATTQESWHDWPHFRLIEVSTPLTYTVSVVQFLVDNGHSETSSSSAVAKLKRGLKQASSMVTFLDMKSDEQMGQLIRLLARGRPLGLLYFLTNCLRPLVDWPRDWAKAAGADDISNIMISRKIRVKKNINTALGSVDVFCLLINLAITAAT